MHANSRPSSAMEPGTRMRLRALKLAEGFQLVRSYYDGRFENELGRIEHLLRTKEDVLAVSCEQMMDLTLDEAKEICREAAVPELLATRIANVLDFEYRPDPKPVDAVPMLDIWSPITTPALLPSSAGDSSSSTSSSSDALAHAALPSFPKGMFARPNEVPSMGAKMTREQIEQQRKLFMATNFSRYGLPQPGVDASGKVTSKATLKAGKEFLLHDLIGETALLEFKDAHPDRIWYDMAAGFCNECFKLPFRKGRDDVSDGEASFQYWSGSIAGYMENGRSKVRLARILLAAPPDPATPPRSWKKFTTATPTHSREKTTTCSTDLCASW